MPTINSKNQDWSTGRRTWTRRQMLAGCAYGLAGAATPAWARAEKPFDAIVVGAGLSGLHAARLLEAQGLTVLVLEGRDRIGGRVYTLKNVPGKPEAAGEVIGANYARMLDTARQLGLELIGPENIASSSKKYFRIRGQNLLAKEWESHELNPLSGDDRRILPDRMLFVLSHKNNPLSNRPLDDWVRPEFQKYDIPQTHYLQEHLGFNAEAIRLMNVVVHTDHMDNTSALHELRRYAVGEFNTKMAKSKPDVPAWLQVKGGNSLMPEAMANSLKHEVLLNKTVHAFEDDGSVVKIHCVDGSRYVGKQVICSMPFPVLRRVLFSPRLPKRMEQAIDEIDYGVSIQVHFLIRHKFWEKDGLPPSMWTDESFERFAVLRRGEGGAPSSAIAFINGNEAYKYDFMTDEEVADFTLRELIRVRPALQDALEPIMVQSCHRDVHGAGDWVFWRPGQVSKFAPFMRESHGNVHFCGEHTALLERGMEGAFESGERAAIDLMLRT